MCGRRSFGRLVKLRNDGGIRLASYLGFQLHRIGPELCFLFCDMTFHYFYAGFCCFCFQRAEMGVPFVDDDGLSLIACKINLSRLVADLYLLERGGPVRLEVFQIGKSIVVQDDGIASARRSFGCFHALADEALEALAATPHGIQARHFLLSLFERPHFPDCLMHGLAIFRCADGSYINRIHFVFHDIFLLFIVISEPAYGLAGTSV